MKHAKRLLSLPLALLLIFSLAACQQTPAETSAPTQTTAALTETTAAPAETTIPEETTEPTEPLSPEEKILAERRDLAEQYMRKMVTLLWRAEDDILYTIASNTLPEEAASDYQLQIIAGRLYSGVPYSFSYCTEASFLDYAVEQSENGIYTISGLTWEVLSGGSTYARIGNDCSSAAMVAWSQIGTSVTGVKSSQFGTENGFLPVGDYTPAESYEDTSSFTVTSENGIDVMYASYAQLQKADVLMRIKSSSNHVRMVVSVDVVYKDDGTIDGWNSTVTTLEQTRTNQQRESNYFDEDLGETVYVIGGVDRTYRFNDLFKDGYVPLTCKELIDPSPVALPEITDSETVFNKDTLLTGTISCNWWIDTVTVTLTDSEGKEIQQATDTASRYSPWAFDMQQFVTDHPNAIRGSIDPASLASGNYHCTVTCHLTTGEEFTVRDFDFTV